MSDEYDQMDHGELLARVRDWRQVANDRTQEIGRLTDERDALRRQYKSHIGTLNAGIRGLERMLTKVEAERDQLRAAARDLVAAAKAWTAAYQTLTAPNVRQRAINDLADAIDAFDPMLSETTAPN